MSRRVVVALNRATEVLRRERELPWYILAVRLGYSPEYFRRAILPAVLELSECIDRDGKYLRWICDNASVMETPGPVDQEPAEV